MNVLSLFDGMGCGRLALDRCGLKVDNYFASEIDKFAMTVTNYHYPDVIQLGDINNWQEWSLPKINLIIAGSPCQGFSNSGLGLNFNDPRSKLYFVFEQIFEFYNPDFWLLENVKMKKEWKDVISTRLGAKPIEIDSALVSAQRRKRFYWSNLDIQQPKDKGILLKDIIESGKVDRDKSFCIDANYYKGGNLKQYKIKKRRQHDQLPTRFRQSELRLMVKETYWEIPESTKKGYVEVTEGDFIDLSFIKSKTRRGRLMVDKCNCLQANVNKYCKVLKDGFRILTPVECERLQTVPDNYTLVPYKNRMMSNTQRYKMLGNGWTIDVISHILKGLK